MADFSNATPLAPDLQQWVDQRVQDLLNRCANPSDALVEWCGQPPRLWTDRNREPLPLDQRELHNRLRPIGLFRVAQELVRYGADVNHLMQSGETPLLALLSSWPMEQADTTTVDHYRGWTLLQRKAPRAKRVAALELSQERAEQPWIQTLDWLLALGARCYHADSHAGCLNGDTPLHLAAEISGAATQRLLAAGAPLDVVNRHNLVPLCLAAYGPVSALDAMLLAHANAPAQRPFSDHVDDQFRVHLPQRAAFQPIAHPSRLKRVEAPSDGDLVPVASALDPAPFRFGNGNTTANTGFAAEDLVAMSLFSALSKAERSPRPACFFHDPTSSHYDRSFSSALVAVERLKTFQDHGIPLCETNSRGQPLLQVLRDNFHSELESVLKNPSLRSHGLFCLYQTLDFLLTQNLDFCAVDPASNAQQSVLRELSQWDKIVHLLKSRTVFRLYCSAFDQTWHQSAAERLSLQAVLCADRFLHTLQTPPSSNAEPLGDAALAHTHTPTRSRTASRL